MPSSSDKADEGLSPCTEQNTRIFSNLGSFDKDDDDDQVVLSPCTKDTNTNTFSNLGSFDNKEDNDEQVLSPCSQDTSIFSNLGIQRRKKGNGTLTDLVSNRKQHEF